MLSQRDGPQARRARRPAAPSARIGWFLTASLLVAAGAGIVALFVVGVMGLGGSRGGFGGGPVIWGGGGGGFGGGGGSAAAAAAASARAAAATSTAAAPRGAGDGALDSSRLVQASPARRARCACGCSAPTRWRASRRASPRARSGTAARSASCVEAGLPISYLRRDATPRERAVAMFGKLGVWDTERNNGVLDLPAARRARDRDRRRPRPGPRTSPRPSGRRSPRRCRSAFRGGDFEGGLMRAIDAVDALLVRHFARAPAADGNERRTRERAARRADRCAERAVRAAPRARAAIQASTAARSLASRCRPSLLRRQSTSSPLRAHSCARR